MRSQDIGSSEALGKADPSVMLFADTKDGKDIKKGQGKIDDKGKLSLRFMVHLGASSSTLFTGILPPLSPRYIYIVTRH